MKVVEKGRFQIYVYEDHNPPHCHVRCSNGEEIIIKIPTLEALYGGIIPKELKKILLDNLEEICSEWEKLN